MDKNNNLDLDRRETNMNKKDKKFYIDEHMKYYHAVHSPVNELARLIINLFWGFCLFIFLMLLIIFIMNVRG